jgi:simple sugar transport system ATP-binding protein
MDVSDRVSVLRRGKLVDTVPTKQVTQESLAKKMVGKDVDFNVNKEKLVQGEPLLEARNLQAQNDREHSAFQDVSFTLHRYEILGIAGIAGNGQRELFEALIGVRKLMGGEIRFDGKPLRNLSPTQIRKLGIAQIPDDRISEGLIMDFTVADNLILGRQRDQDYRRGMFLNRRQILSAARDLISTYNILPASPTNRTGYLSGGNLQKVILARELSQKINCLVANQPTRGLDVGVIEYIHQRLLELRKDGMGILLFSEDLDELLALSDRIAVMFRGKIVQIFDAASARLEDIGLCMAGIDASAP